MNMAAGGVRAVAFDLDDTLNRWSADLARWRCDADRRIRSRHDARRLAAGHPRQHGGPRRSGVPIDVDVVLGRLGPKLEWELAQWFPADQVEAMSERYRALYWDNCVGDGTVAVRRGARRGRRRPAAGGRVIVVTAKSESLAFRCLDVGAPRGRRGRRARARRREARRAHRARGWDLRRRHRHRHPFGDRRVGDRGRRHDRPRRRPRAARGRRRHRASTRSTNSPPGSRRSADFADEQREPAPPPQAVDLLQPRVAHPAELRLDVHELIGRIVLGAARSRHGTPRAAPAWPTATTSRFANTPPGRSCRGDLREQRPLAASSRWWIAKPDTTRSKAPRPAMLSDRSCSTTCTRASPANRCRAFSSIGGDVSTATTSRTSGRASSTSAVSRPSPHPRSATARERRGAPPRALPRRRAEGRACQPGRGTRRPSPRRASRGRRLRSPTHHAART